MIAGLPNTVAGLRADLQARVVSLADALERQREVFARRDETCRAATSRFEAVAPNTGLSLPLAGVGVAHKDIFDLAGRQPGLGRDSGTSAPGLAPAWAPARLERAGAINLGALAMAEDACSATGHTENLPTPVNPLGADIAVGGSSSGSAVAVASGMVYASLGTDTAGSVRIPAMTCGVMGLKTTHGLIPRDGMSLLSPSLDSIGVLARSTGDLAGVLRVLAPQLDWQAAASPASIKVGYWLDGVELVDAVKDVVAGAMDRYGQIPILPVEHERRASALQELLMAYEVGQTHAARIAAGQACEQVTGLGTYGLTIPEVWWHAARLQRRDCLRAFVEDVFSQIDVLLAPLQTDVLPKTSEVYLGHPGFKSAKLLGLHRYCGWVNYLGLPALSMPIGVGPDGLPVSIQLIGKPFHEPQLLAVGRQIQADRYGENGIMLMPDREGQNR